MTTRNKQPRICMIVQQVYDQDARVMRYTEALVQAGALVDVLSTPSDEKMPINRGGGLRVFTIPLAHTSQSLVSYLFEYLLAMILFSFRLLSLHIKSPYDLIHVHNMPDFLVFAAFLPRIFGAKLILDIHDPMPEFYQAKFQKKADRPLVRMMRLQERWSAAFSHAVLTANPTFKENLIVRGIPAGKITVTQNLPDRSVFNRNKYPRTTDWQKRFTLLYPGTIAPRYGLHIAIRSLPMLIKEIPVIRLRIIGDDNRHTRALNSPASDLGVAAYVDIVSLIPRDKIPEEMSRADIGIYPALPDPHMSIAMPGKVLEYAIMGLPTVTSRLPVLENVFSDNTVYYIPPGEPEAFAQAILDLYLHPEKKDALVNCADKEFVQVQNWEIEKQKYFHVLARLLPANSNFPMP
ncbi:MAG: glycosyltransferase [Anaerolineaceae bacterium]|nr:glycosyltransferase [Anaerolineaceae bacterium]